MTTFLIMHPNATPEHLGFYPEIFQDTDPRPARDQINDRYAHGGGWHPLAGFTINATSMALSYPEDPPLEPFAMAELPLTRETVWFYPYDQVAVVQEDGSFEAGRMD